MIVDAPDGDGVEITSSDIEALTAGSVDTLYAVTVDEDGDYKDNVDVTWSVTGGIGSISQTSGSYTVLTIDPIAPPDSLKSVTLDGKIGLNWLASTSSPDKYNVYRSISQDGSNAILVTSVIGTSAEDANATNGELYYYYVTSSGMTGSIKAVDNSGTAEDGEISNINMPTESGMSNIVDDSPEPQYTAVEVYIRSGSGYSTLDFSTGTTYSLNDANAVHLADIWLDNSFNITGCENSGGALSGDWSRTTYITDFGRANFDDPDVSVAPVYDPGDQYWGDFAEAIVGHVYALYTEEGSYVKLRVDDQGSDYIKVTYGYQKRTDYLNFKTAAQ
jgi:hypothetical protein